MARARKCDRCGKLHEIYGTRNNPKNINSIKTCNQDVCGNSYFHGYYDLCPECSKFLVDWLFEFEKKDNVKES